MNTYEETMRRVNAACDGIAETLVKIQAERAADGFSDVELSQRSADWLYARSCDVAGDEGYGPLAAAAMSIDFDLGKWDRANALRAADGELCGYVDDETGHACERKATRRRFMKDGVCDEHGERMDREEQSDGRQAD